jgi:excisionase family DNA binding protein
MAQTTDQPAIYPDVLTLAEAAAYLRVSEAEIIELMRRQSLPARKVGEQWRFLKAAIQEWLRLPEKENFWWKQFGALKDDPNLEQMVEQIYRERGRPGTVSFGRRRN